MNNIIIVTGGSGGHIFPALSLARKLRSKEPGLNIIFISKPGVIEDNLLPKTEFKTYTIPVEKFSLSFGLPRALARFIKSFFVSNSILKEAKPRAVIGFGGYVSIPVIVASRLRRIPTVIHEQNVTFGRANLFLTPWARKVAVSFPDTEGKLKNPLIRKKMFLAGNPIREEFYGLKKDDCYQFFGLQKEKFTLLVLGGSQGSLNVNKLVQDALTELPKSLAHGLQVMHVLGKENRFPWHIFYNSLGVKVKIYNFLRGISRAYCVADMVIARAGATTVAELSSYGVASILIPYPFAKKHQLNNALVLASKNAAFLVEEDSNAAKKLSYIINKAIQDKTFLKTMTLRTQDFTHRDAADNLAQEVLALC